MTLNVLGIAEGGGFLAHKLKRRAKAELCTNVQSKPFSPAFGNTLLGAGLFLSDSLHFFGSVK